MSKIKHFCLGGSLLLVLSSCANLFGPDPHENFKESIGFYVGYSIDKPRLPGVTRREIFLSSRMLPNGNIENKYKYVWSCRYFFEYDPETRMIVGWRFEGSEEDCVVNP